ncbi:MAG: hypothetical protein ABR583_00470 [Gaiellaceae bacterium]
MTLGPSWPRTLQPPKHRRRWRRWSAAAVVVAAVFAAGFALGDALDDNVDPERGGTQTLVRTLTPLPLTASPTVTVTVTSP